jgi:hypothetical protein
VRQGPKRAIDGGLGRAEERTPSFALDHSLNTGPMKTGP